MNTYISSQLRNIYMGIVATYSHSLKTLFVGRWKEEEEDQEEEGAAR